MRNFTVTTSQQADFGMPAFGRGRIASPRALPMMTTGVAMAAGSKSVQIDATPVCGYRPITDVAVLTGAFPGTSAWRPPN
jgi:hypothetical protein